MRGPFLAAIIPLLMMIAACGKESGSSTVEPSLIYRWPFRECVPGLDTCMSDCDLRKDYMRIWKEEFLLRNRMSEDYFRRHISVNTTYLANYRGDYLFTVSYTVTIDWAVICCSDWLPVKLSTTNGRKEYANLGIRRDEFLTREDIVKYLDSVQDLVSVKSVPKLRYDSRTRALQECRRKAGTENVFAIEYYYPRDYPRGKKAFGKGYPHMRLGGQADLIDALCISGDMNLADGEAYIQVMPCIVID